MTLKSTFTALAATFLLGLSSVAADQPAAAPSASSTAGEDNAAVETKEGKKKMIEKGMSGDDITKLFGRPAEIKPMKVEDPATKAEQWIYRRKLKESTIQSADSQGSMPSIGASGTAQTMVEIPTMIMRLKRITIYQVTALLMVNGKLEVAKQWAEKEEGYVD